MIKKISTTAFILAIVASVCFAGQMMSLVGQGSGSGCTSYSATLDESGNTGDDVGLTTWSKGNSFRVPYTRKIRGIELIFAASYSGDMEVRWGTSDNLTTCAAPTCYSKTASFTSQSSYFFEFDDYGDAATGTTYYFAAIKTSGTVRLEKSSSDGYDCSPGDCKYYYADGADWHLDGSAASDLAFKVYQCD